MTHHTDTRRPSRHLFYASPGRFSSTLLLSTFFLGACDATARIPAYATVTCFCRPLRPDSVRGTFRVATRGLRQITGRVDATLYFTEWNDPARHVTYSLHQRIDLVK